MPGGASEMAILGERVRRGARPRRARALDAPADRRDASSRSRSRSRASRRPRTTGRSRCRSMPRGLAILVCGGDRGRLPRAARGRAHRVHAGTPPRSRSRSPPRACIALLGADRRSPTPRRCCSAARSARASSAASSRGAALRGRARRVDRGDARASPRGVGCAHRRRAAAPTSAAALLAAAPGGIAEMSITAKVLRIGVAFVTAAHVVRYLVVDPLLADALQALPEARPGRYPVERIKGTGAISRPHSRNGDGEEIAPVPF